MRVVLDLSEARDERQVQRRGDLASGTRPSSAATVCSPLTRRTEPGDDHLVRARFGEVSDARTSIHCEYDHRSRKRASENRGR